MRRYTDRHGKEHSVAITLKHRQQIRDALEIDLVKCAHDADALSEMLTQMSEDDLTIWEMLAIVEGVSSDELLSAADGSTHEAASEALLGAIVDFFPQRSPLRAPLTELIAKTHAAATTAAETAGASLMEIVNGLNIESVLSDAAARMNGS